MVKGVNKTIIEVNNTGSKIFDRIVFYVSPSCSNLSAKNLNRAVKNFTFSLDERAGRGYQKTLRHRHVMRRRAIVAAALGIFAIACITLALIL